MNKLTSARRVQIVRALVEGNSIRATCRMTDTAKGTVLKLLADLGAACDAFSNAHLCNLGCKRVQLDEIWSFVYAKKANVPENKLGEFGYGDVWTWTAIDADTKLVVSWHVGTRETSPAMTFTHDLRSRIKNGCRVQITSDGHSPYLWAVATAFAEGEADYAMLHKAYKPVVGPAGRYSPPACVGVTLKTVFGNPDMRHVSTSFAERNNLTMRMGMRRFTRLTNGFSKKLANHEAALALHFAHYNFCRIHQTLRVTPAMAAGVVDRVMGVEDLVSLLDSN